MISAQSRPSFFARAFSLIEILSVLAVLSVLTGITVPAVKGLTSSSSLDTGITQFANLLHFARSEAIARHTVVRFAVARNWTGNEDEAMRRVSLWAWNDDIEQYVQISRWEDLPVGVCLESELPGYIKDSSYASADRASVRGDYVLGDQFAEEAEFLVGPESEQITARYIEFLPSGRVRVPGGNLRQAIFVAAPGHPNTDGTVLYTSRDEAGQPASWAQVNVDTLTGRVRVYQP